MGNLIVGSMHVWKIILTTHLDICWQIVKHHPHEVGRERQVFVDFFCAPDRLRTQVRDLSARVMALQT